MKQFHVTKASRDKYQFDEVLFSKNGNVIFANFQAAREFAHRINSIRPDTDDQETFFAPGDINALGLIDEIFHQVMDDYYQTHGRGIQTALARHLIQTLGREATINTLIRFNEQFPPTEVYQGDLDVGQYLKGNDHGITNYDVTVEEMLMTWLTNINPAASRYREIFDDRPLYSSSSYAKLLDELDSFFKTQPTFGPENQDLVTMLRTPALRVPDSLTGQLEYIKEHWGEYLSDFFLRLLGSLDMLAEETKAKAMFFQAAPDFSQSETFVPDYQTGFHAWGEPLSEFENFSPDSDWMPRVVMLAKNVFVWLNQLSRQFERDIETLDQIPDETLDQLITWGFTGLWLIGLWERSEASREIKQMCGNPDAVSSAYSLARYQIADRLGGEAAYYNLSQRCGARGIRLASDMVPNHMGIDSDWVYDHPDWFIQSEHSPFPVYSFDGPDLSKRDGISINLEDHYFSRTDAAVVFKRFDHYTGETRFIYHGNDGTSMPWNDTAQLNYLNPEVREAVIQTILAVARRFPIIRFDAAMTLTKKHYQRLWFPQPGSGGDIPSRADYSMSKETFDQTMPEEFWREVVDRVAAEVPDTLLLAEAFWLMEGYFVRTLGMHRVYNSAFMNMLRNEENEKYRLLIKNTLVYDPQILKRYVNFMNNPDEKTAVEQFGKGDKYFGICTLLSTMPGLPMFGHGQVEGYSEKYGMEYYRPYLEEYPDQALIDHHSSVIFPLLHRRRVFAEVENFRLYDLVTDGGVDENVFVYSNHLNGHSALVIYNNRYGDTSGWIKGSAPFLVKDGSDGYLQQSDLADALFLQGGDGAFVVYFDNVSKNFFIRTIEEIRTNGLRFELGPYAHHVLIDFKVVTGEQFAQLHRLLAGQPIRDINASLEELTLAPLLRPLEQLLDTQNLEKLRISTSDEERTRLFKQNRLLLDQIWQELYPEFGLDQKDDESQKLLKAILSPEALSQEFGLSAMKRTQLLVDEIVEELDADPRKTDLLLIWATLSSLVNAGNITDTTNRIVTLLERKPVANLVRNSLAKLGFTEYESWKNYQLLLALLGQGRASDRIETQETYPLETWIADSRVLDYLDVNTHNEIRWFNKERFEDFVWYQKATNYFALAFEEEMELSEVIQRLLEQEKVFDQIIEAEEASEYQLDKLLPIFDEN